MAVGAVTGHKERQMKKFITIVSLCATLMAVVMTSCSRMEYDPSDARVISFAVARHALPATRAESNYADDFSNVPFGAYAWYKDGSAAGDTDFMTNQKVIFDGAVWRPDGVTYYWPNGGALDFISYSPFSADGGPAVAENSITWNNWSVTDNPSVDLMYATKAPGMTAATTTYYYSGVPTLFHHALAKLGLKLRLAYSEVEAPTGDKTRWDVTVHSMKLTGIYGTGSLTLNLDDDGREWKKPDSNVWTVSGDSTDIILNSSQLPKLENTDIHTICEPMMVLPQSVGPAQRLEMVVTIHTWRDTGEGYKLFLTEDHVTIAGNLATSAIPGWGINQNITYTFLLAPSLAGNSGTDLDGDGFEDQEPVIIKFDPAVDYWESIELTTSIKL